MKGRANIQQLNFKDGGIAETGKVNKNREALFVYDRKKPLYSEKSRLIGWLEEAIVDLHMDKSDCIIITVKERTW